MPMYNIAKYADARMPDMIMRLEAGATLEEVGDVYGITKERVRQLTNGHVNLEKRRAVRRESALAMIDQYKDEIVQDWLDGKTDVTIAKDLGMPFVHLQARLREWVSEMDEIVVRARDSTRRKGNRVPISDEECIALIRFIAEQEGRTPSLVDYRKWREQFPAWPSVPTMTGRGRKWNDLVRRAGLVPNEKPTGMGLRKYSDEDLFSVLRHVRDIVGHLPTVAEYNRHRPGGSITEVGIIKRFGSWNESLKAFVEHEATS